MTEAKNYSAHSRCAGATAVITGLNDHRIYGRSPLAGSDLAGPMCMFTSWKTLAQVGKAAKAALDVKIT